MKACSDFKTYIWEKSKTMNAKFILDIAHYLKPKDMEKVALEVEHAKQNKGKKAEENVEIEPEL